ncbi:UpxY family transcription antiterminator [Flammeovirga sp. SubArs3]|uniref:UpxY family transcription antiterminator n=1 Tax=Flammeovirga sp. SubArs3 TaxID=2995316 RepID=UPI00248AAF12|nr:UpxY family transcription antiterminator [Flammeovirga sp. SubArs3]
MQTSEHKKVWLAIYTKPRAEKKVADRLEKNGFEVYCPTYTTIRQWSDRKKKVVIPAIPSYCFIKIEEHKRWDALKDPGAVRYIFWQGKPAVIKEPQILAFKRFMGEIGENEEIFSSPLSEGDKVLVRSGSFTGIEADILKIRKKEVQLILPELELKLVCQRKDIDKIG